MAERRTTETADRVRFYRGRFQYGSVYSDEMTPEARNEYRAIYRRLLKQYGGWKSWQARTKARKMIRAMLYSDYGSRRSKSGGFKRPGQSA